MSVTFPAPLVSVVIISFNTRDLLRDCLRSLKERAEGIPMEIFVVDNVSRDGSADMVAAEFPDVHLIRNTVNRGFGGANNQAFARATGQYVVLLNSDAFLEGRALALAVDHMEKEPVVGIGGARLVGRDGLLQPSARLFPSPLNHFLTISGLSVLFPRSRFFGRENRTWADPNEAADVDWVPGAFSIIRRSALEKVGYFDEKFFLYYEEVDLCKRLKQAGYRIRYWPDLVVVHLGGESSKTIETLRFSQAGSQLSIWQMRSVFLYYRKHHGPLAWVVKEVELRWHWLRAKRNSIGARSAAKAKDSEGFQLLLNQAWRETAGGRISPPQPW